METETDADIFTLEIDKTETGAGFGGNTRITKRVIAKPENNFKLINIFDHKIFANDINESLKNKLPFVFIEEYSLISNSLVNQFRYFGSIANFRQVVERQTQALTNVVEQTQQQVPVLGGDLATKTVELINGLLGSAANVTGLSDLASNIDPSKIFPLISNQNIKESTFNEQLIGPSLKPYNGLYQTAPTGFKYIMPYFDDKHYDINNKFVDNFTGFMGVETQPLKFAPNIFRIGADMLKNVGEAFLSLPTSTGGAYNSPSTYVEIPQYFAAGEYESYNVTFNLLNTFNEKDIQKNYDLLFLLAFQNLPYREDIAKITPPKLYTLLIPGQIFLPYCHMKSIKVDYVGNRRQVSIKKHIYKSDVDIILPKEKQSIIVPDCYKVTIEFLSMVKPASNFMLVPDIKVTFSTPQTTITAAEVTGQNIRQNSSQQTPTKNFPTTTSNGIGAIPVTLERQKEILQERRLFGLDSNTSFSQRLIDNLLTESRLPPQ